MYSIPLDNMEAHPTLSIRDIKEWYVDYLSEMIKEDDQEELTSPLLVEASVAKDEFKPRDLSKYTYQVSFTIIQRVYR